MLTMNFKLTQAGNAAVWDSTNRGLEVVITHCQLGSAYYDPTGAEAALQAPVAVSTFAAGTRLNNNTQIRFSSIFSGNQAYQIGEIGLWAGEPGLAGSVLVMIWSRASGIVGTKFADIDFVFSNNMVLDTAVPAGSINISVDNGQSAEFLALLAEHEADPNAHPYVPLDEGTGFWKAGIIYKKNARCIDTTNGIEWQSLQDFNQGNVPGTATSAEWWAVTQIGNVINGGFYDDPSADIGLWLGSSPPVSSGNLNDIEVISGG